MTVFDSRDPDRYRLSLAREPETRHRARYQTEGSRGAVKDSTGKTSPQVVVSQVANSRLALYRHRHVLIE